MTPLGNLNIDFVFDSGGTKPGLQAPRFYPTMYQPALPTKSLSYTSLSFRIREIFWGREGGGGVAFLITTIYEVFPYVGEGVLPNRKSPLGSIEFPTGSPSQGSLYSLW